MVFLVLYTPRRQALNRFHGVSYRLEPFRSNEDSKSPCRRGADEEGGAHASAAVYHLPSFAQRCCSSGGPRRRRRRRRKRAKQSLRVRESRRWEGGRGVDGARARLFWVRTGGWCWARWRLLHAAKRAAGFEGLSELFKGLCLSQSAISRRITHKTAPAKPF